MKLPRWHQRDVRFPTRRRSARICSDSILRQSDPERSKVQDSGKLGPIIIGECHSSSFLPLLLQPRRSRKFKCKLKPRYGS